MGLKALQSLLDEISQDVTFALVVLDLVSDVCVRLLEKVHYWQNLSVVGHESLTDSIRASHQALQDLEGDCDDLWVTSVQGS